MSRYYFKALALFLVLLLFLFVTNPSESTFLEKVSTDYGQIHAGMNIGVNDLKEMGMSKRSSYLLFSMYQYQFGNIGVRYLGIAANTFFLGTYKVNTQSDRHIDYAFASSHTHKKESMETSKNVLGTELQECSTNSMTGFYRDGCCNTGPMDRGTHTVCAEVNEEFLKFTKSQGNDLSTPRPEYNFPGLKPGDRWCLCVLRWLEAHKAGKAPAIVLEATHSKTLDYVNLEVLKEYQFKSL